LDIDLDWAKDFFMSLDSLVQGAQQSLCRVEVDDDSLIHLDGASVWAQGIGVHSEVDNHFFRTSGYPTEVGVAAVSL
jgi:hypothetical protein